MLLVGLLVTMGIGSSFSTVPILAAIFVPLCVQLGFDPLATVCIVGTAGALGGRRVACIGFHPRPDFGAERGWPASPYLGHRVPTFIHYNLPLLAFGWLAAMVL